MLLMVVFVLLFPHTMTDDIDNQVTLHIKESCWFHLEQDPILVCTVTSPTHSVIWKRDTTPIAIDGFTVGDDRHLYNISSYNKQNGTVRVEILEMSENISSVAVEAGSKFWCENQALSSKHKPLIIPGCEVCNSCLTTTGLVHVASLPVVPGDSSKATLILVVTFSVAALVIFVVVVIYVCSRRKHETTDQQNHNDADSCIDDISERDELGSLCNNFTPMQTRRSASSSMPVLTSSSLQGTPPGSVRSLSKVEYMKPNDYPLKKMPSYQRMRASLLHSSFTGSNAPIVIPEEDAL